MLKMKEHKSKFVASILTLFVIGLLIIAGPASAFEVSIAEFDNATPTQGETVSTIATIDIASLERANITKITLF